MKRRSIITAALAAALAALLCLTACGDLSVRDMESEPTLRAASAIKDAVKNDETYEKIATAVNEALRNGSVEASVYGASGTLGAKFTTSERDAVAALSLSLDAGGKKNDASLFIARDRAVLFSESILGGAYGIRLGDENDGASSDDESPPSSAAEYDLRLVTDFCSRVSEFLGQLKKLYDAGGYAAAATERLDKCVTAIEEREVQAGGKKYGAIAVDYRLKSDDLAELGAPISALLDIFSVKSPALSALLGENGEDGAASELTASVFIDRSSRRAVRIDGTLAASGVRFEFSVDFSPENGEDITIRADGATLSLARRIEGGEITRSLKANFSGVSAALDLSYNSSDGAFSLDLSTDGAPFDTRARIAGTAVLDGDGKLTIETKQIAVGDSELPAALVLSFVPGEAVSPTPDFKYISDFTAADWAELAARVVSNGDNIRAISEALPALFDGAPTAADDGDIAPSDDGEADEIATTDDAHADSAADESAPPDDADADSAADESETIS